MTINFEYHGKYCIIFPGNDLGMMDMAEKLGRTLENLIEQGNKHICVDLNKAPVIDSRVIGALVDYHKKLSQENGELVVISKHNMAIEAMMSMRLGRIMRFVETKQEL